MASRPSRSLPRLLAMAFRYSSEPDSTSTVLNDASARFPSLIGTTTELSEDMARGTKQTHKRLKNEEIRKTHYPLVFARNCKSSSLNPEVYGLFKVNQEDGLLLYSPLMEIARRFLMLIQNRHFSLNRTLTLSLSQHCTPHTLAVHTPPVRRQHGTRKLGRVLSAEVKTQFACI